MSSLVFVYGTLKQTEGNNWLMQKVGARFVAIAHTIDKFAVFGEIVPVMCHASGLPDRLTGHVVGELFEFPTEHLVQLDRFEAAYRREQIQVLNRMTEETVEAFAYVRQHVPGRLFTGRNITSYRRGERMIRWASSANHP